MADDDQVSQLEILAENIENSCCRVCRAQSPASISGLPRYAPYYAVRTLADCIAHAWLERALDPWPRSWSHAGEQAWINLGGQLVPGGEV